MIQKGLFIVIFSNPNAQRTIVEKQFWIVGNVEYRALPWSLDFVNDEILALASPRWITVSNLPPYVWNLVQQILEPFGKVLKMDRSNTLIPNSDIRILFSILPSVEAPKKISLELGISSVVCPITYMEGLNACYLCKKGHRRKQCPLLAGKPVRNQLLKTPPLPKLKSVVTSLHNASPQVSLDPKASRCLHDSNTILKTLDSLKDKLSRPTSDTNATLP